MENIKTDHRSRVTKILIRKAFMELFLQKPVQSISVKELCEKAHINRGTFYSHYTDIYDLLNKIEEELFDEITTALSPLLSEDNKTLTPQKLTTEIFVCLKENSDLCTVTLSDFGDKKFLFKLIDLGRDICLKSYSRFFENASRKKIQYFYAFASAGCIGVLHNWLSEKMVTPPSEIAKMVDEIMLTGINFLK